MRHVEAIHYPGTFQYECEYCRKKLNSKSQLANHKYKFCIKRIQSKGQWSLDPKYSVLMADHLTCGLFWFWWIIILNQTKRSLGIIFVASSKLSNYVYYVITYMGGERRLIAELSQNPLGWGCSGSHRIISLPHSEGSILIIFKNGGFLPRLNWLEWTLTCWQRWRG